MARRADRKWTAIVAAAERSGRAHTQIAKQHGVTVAALKYHIYKSRREGRGSGVQVLPVRTDGDAVARGVSVVGSSSVKRCRVVAATSSERVGEKTRYAPSFIAHLIVNKCGDTNPQYRLEKAYKTLGIPISRSTMCSLLHRGAGELQPLYDAMLRHVPEAEDVHANETSARQQGLDKRAYMWTFVTPTFVVYRYATTRSGSVPEAVLGGSQGRLVVDQYTGHNKVAAPGRRLRAGCLAHARRKIFEQSEHPETTEALDLIGEIYKLEASAKAAGILGTPAHLQMRIDKTRSLKLLCWGRRHRGGFPPRSGMGKAIRYLLKTFASLAYSRDTRRSRRTTTLPKRLSGAS
ncbi:MAG: IS66 family transposase [Polyangiaceae bacterium]